MRNKEPKLYWRKINKNGKWSFVKAEVKGFQHPGYAQVKEIQEEE
jgi:hypothetical protein